MRSCLLLHGMGGTGQQWARTRLLLEAAGMEVRSPDLRAPTVRGLVEEVRPVVASRPTLVAGVSMGAAAAVALAFDDPGAVAALILVAPAVDPDGLAPATRTMLEGRANALERGGFEGLRAHFLQVGHPRLPAQQLAAGVDELRKRTTAEELIALWRQFPGQLPFATWDDLGRIEVPARVLGWREDPIHPFEFAVETARSLADAELIEVPTPVGDLPAEEMAAAILSLAELPGERLPDR